VRDSGSGISPEVQARMFEPFFTTKPSGQGTGLGLPICRGIIEGHSGQIRVDSRPGHGATFFVELPVTAPPAAANACGSDIVPRVEGRRILVVDDEPDVANILADFLSRDGHSVDKASDGAAALEKLDQQPFDLILSDVRMPTMDGPALYEAIGRRAPRLLERVIFFTGDTLSPRTQTFLEGTRAATLSKPFDFSEVRRVVARLLRHD
jgi:two-component system NtrC family sensor kinase